jgi:hypothetical protein
MRAVLIASLIAVVSSSISRSVIHLNPAAYLPESSPQSPGFDNPTLILNQAQATENAVQPTP